MHLDFDTPIEYDDEYMKYRHCHFFFMTENITGREAKLFKSTKSIQQPAQ